MNPRGILLSKHYAFTVWIAISQKFCMTFLLEIWRGVNIVMKETSLTPIVWKINCYRLQLPFRNALVFLWFMFLEESFRAHSFVLFTFQLFLYLFFPRSWDGLFVFLVTIFLVFPFLKNGTILFCTTFWYWLFFYEETLYLVLAHDSLLAFTKLC